MLQRKNSNNDNGNGQSSESFFEREACELALHELPDFVLSFVQSAQPGSWFFLNGDLGAGKTHFVAQVAQALGVKEIATSPTFALMQTHSLPESFLGFQKILHLDLYRLKKGNELCYLGLETEFNAMSIAFFEWAELVAPEDWEQFFIVTGCLRPAALWEIQISPAQSLNKAEARVYSFVDRSDLLL